MHLAVNIHSSILFAAVRFAVTDRALIASVNVQPVPAIVGFLHHFAVCRYISVVMNNNEIFSQVPPFFPLFFGIINAIFIQCGDVCLSLSFAH